MYRNEAYHNKSLYTKIFIVIHIHMWTMFMDENQQIEIDSYYFGQTIGIESPNDVSNDSSSDASTH